MKLKSVKDVSDWRLCLGCGACAYACPERCVTLVDVYHEGIRPLVAHESCSSCSECVKVCPGHELAHCRAGETDEAMKNIEEGWGPVLDVWEGYAVDPQIRFLGSSGGAATAISLYCMEKESMRGVLHIAQEPGSLRNKTCLSTARSELLSRTGSRYSPASPCDGLCMVEASAGPCVFIGKPCDVAALRKTQALRPELDKNVGVAIAIFCAGTPSTKGTVELLKRLGLSPEETDEIRYRGMGWPGDYTARIKGDKEPAARMSYKEAWSFLQKYRQQRCYLCPDGTGEFADISCGDAWRREAVSSDAGWSLVLARTEKGRRILKGAMDSGYLALKRTAPSALQQSQANLLQKRKAIWGRILAMKAFGIPAPRLKGFSLFKNWLGLPAAEKARSILGTSRRILQRGYYRRKGEKEYSSGR